MKIKKDKIKKEVKISIDPEIAKGRFANVFRSGIIGANELCIETGCNTFDKVVVMNGRIFLNESGFQGLIKNLESTWKQYTEWKNKNSKDKTSPKTELTYIV